MRRRTHTTRAAVMILAGLAMMLVTPAALLAQTPPEGGETVDLLSFGLASDANGVSTVFGDPAVQPYPVGASQSPHAYSNLGTGPTGYALASSMWPGPLAGNAGSLAALVGGPPEAGAANYPVRAEAFSSGPNRTELPEGQPTMIAVAEGPFSSAHAEARDVESADGFGFGSAVTDTVTQLSADAGVSESHAVVNDITFTDAITIDSVTTFARVTTNGTTSTIEGDTVVSGLTIGGQPATVDEDGITFTDSTNPNPINAVTQQVGEQVLSQMDIEMFTTSPIVRQDGAEAYYLSGSLVVIWKPGGGPNQFVMTFGGSEASVRSAPALPDFEVDLPPIPDAPPPQVDSATPTTSAPVAAPTPTAAPTPAPTAAPAPAPAPNPSVPVSAQPVFDTYFYGIPWGLVVLSILGALLAGAGLRRLRENAFAAAATLCPIEGATS